MKLRWVIDWDMHDDVMQTSDDGSAFRALRALVVAFPFGGFVEGGFRLTDGVSDGERAMELRLRPNIYKVRGGGKLNKSGTWRVGRCAWPGAGCERLNLLSSVRAAHGSQFLDGRRKGVPREHRSGANPSFILNHGGLRSIFNTAVKAS